MCILNKIVLYILYSDFTLSYLLLSQSHNTGLTTGSDDSSLAWIHIGVPVILVAVLLVIVSVACLFVVIALKRCTVTYGQLKKGKLNNLIDCLIIVFFYLIVRNRANGTGLKRRNEG